MRFLRLRVANYRGIESCEVTFSPDGITLIQGPNEIGKSSLAEAIRILFEYHDTSQRREVEAIRPVHRDESPEIELQAETGPYAFRYFKKFCKKGDTRLSVTRPSPENHTGREAHERAEAILSQTIDLDLWKALSIQQGDAIEQPDLAKQKSLSAALDQAAGGRSADPQEEGLFAKVTAEYGSYFTQGGAEKKELQESRKRLAEVQAEIVTVEKQINDLERDIERSATLRRELKQLKKLEAEQTQEAEDSEASLQRVVALENALAAAGMKLQLAQKSEQSVRRDKDERQSLIDVVEKMSAAHADVQGSGEASVFALNTAEEELRKALATFNEADERKKQADALAALRRADFDHYNNRLHLEQLKERKDRIDQARKTAAEAEDLLRRIKVNARALKSIQEAERGLLAAEARLETGAPNVVVRAMAECRLEIDEASVALWKGETRTTSVADRMCLTVPDMLHIEIHAGSGAEDLSRKVAEARGACEDACKAAAVASADAARTAFEHRRGAERDLKSAEAVERENLRDLTYEQLERKLKGLQLSVPGYLESRVREPSVCADLDSAKREWTNSEVVQKKAAARCEEARKLLDAARSMRERLSLDHQKTRVQLEILARDVGHARENLDRARRAVTDDQLDANLREAARLLSCEISGVTSAEASLAALNPERVRAAVETANGSLRTTQKRLSDVHTELTEVRTRLTIHGEEGLHERLNAAQSRCEHLQKDNEALFRRAAATRLLFEIMRDEREKARRAYVAPLKERIEQLGRLVFDVSFQVEVNNDLQISARTCNGTTVPFASLSGGTREQLSLLFRLACSMIVAKDGGVPLIVDDALGYTDPERLRSMGLALAKAARQCQIIVFTCVPERYCNVGEVSVVSLGRNRRLQRSEGSRS